MSRSIVITQNISVDGVVESNDETGGWFADQLPQEQHAALAAVVREQTARETGILLGRRTFLDFRGYWAGLDDPDGIGPHLDGVDKYVVSRTLTEPGWQHTTVLPGDADLLDRVREVRASRDDGDLGVTGSIGLCHTLLAAGLVDELRLFVYPVVLGRGRRPLVEGGARRDLEPIECRSFGAGITLQTFRIHR